MPIRGGVWGGYIGSTFYSSTSLSKKKNLPKKVCKQKTPLMWGFEFLMFPSNFLSISTCNFINVFIIEYYYVQFSI